MSNLIVITTTKQAEAMLKILDQEHKIAQADNYAKERKKPIRWMSCTCCGEGYRGRQWFNQDTGYGLGDCCVEYCGVNPAGGESDCYGVPGIHFLIPADEESQLDEMIGESLHGIDERLRIDCQGYIFWKGLEIEHWSGSLLDKSDKAIREANDLIQRCEILESRGEAINSSTVIWQWED